MLRPMRNWLDPPLFVVFTFLLLFLGLTPEEVNGIRIEAKPRATGTSSFLQQRQGKDGAGEVATTATTTTTALTLAGLMQRMTAIQGVVKALDAKVTSLHQSASKVEAQMKFTGTTLATSMKSLTKIKTDSSANQKVALRIRDQSKVLETKSFEKISEMDVLMKKVNGYEMSTKLMGKSSVDLGNNIRKLEATVTEALPGVGGISGKLDKIETDIKNFDATLKKGIEAQVGVELGQVLGKVQGEVKGLADELEKRKLKEDE